VSENILALGKTRNWRSFGRSLVRVQRKAMDGSLAACIGSNPIFSTTLAGSKKLPDVKRKTHGQLGKTRVRWRKEDAIELESAPMHRC
jgi:hypothetical protein